MSVLPAGRPLRRFLPDLDDLLYDPRAYLGAGPVLIGPRRMYGLTALFALPGLALLASWIWAGRTDGERLALGVALLLGAAVWLGWSLLLRGHELALLPDGIEVRYRGSVVWAPWALFNADGSPVVPPSDSPRLGLTLPIAPEAVPFVELRRDDSVVACGAQVQAPQWRFTPFNEVVLPARYEVQADELGELILQLGGRLGRQLPRTTPPPEAHRPAEPEDVGPDAEGWLTVPLTRLSLPAYCCDCDQPTGETMPWPVAGRWTWLLGPLRPDRHAQPLHLPLCSACRERTRRRLARGGGLGLGLGAVLGVGTVVLLKEMLPGLLPPLGVPVGLLLLIFALALVVGAQLGFILGLVAGTVLIGNEVVQVRSHSPAAGTVRLRFRNPDYAARVLEALRAPRSERGSANG
jgi:hypothetical protein